MHEGPESLWVLTIGIDAHWVVRVRPIPAPAIVGALGGGRALLCDSIDLFALGSAL